MCRSSGWVICRSTVADLLTAVTDIWCFVDLSVTVVLKVSGNMFTSASYSLATDGLAVAIVWAASGVVAGDLS